MLRVPSLLSTCHRAIIPPRTLIHTLSLVCQAKGIDLLKLERNNGTSRTGAADDETQHVDFLYGIHPVKCALEAKRRTINKVYYRHDLIEHNQRVKSILQMCWSQSIPVKDLSKAQVDALVPRARTHQGIVAEATRLYCKPVPFKTVEEMCRKGPGDEKQVWLMLSGIQDPMNFGSILRSAYFLGCDHIFVTSHNSCSLSPVVSKASSGAMELVTVHSISNLPGFCRILRQLDWDVIGTTRPDYGSASAIIPCGSFELEKSSLILLGNEGSGLDEEQLTGLCNKRICIPSRRDLNPSVDSLNVSAAAAILLQRLLSPSAR